MLHKRMYRSSHFVIALVLSQTKNTQAHCTHLWTHRAITHTCAHALEKGERRMPSGHGPGAAGRNEDKATASTSHG